mgnify:FL=1
MKKLLLIILLITSSMYSQNYELYSGAVISEDKDMKMGYMIGANFIIKTNQERQYLNHLLFGAEHSGLMSGNTISNFVSEKTAELNCNCEQDNLDFNSQYSIKKMTRGVSLTFGVEIAKRWYLLTGITNYQHITKINNQKTSEYRTTYIDAGIKYFIKSKDWFFTPTFKFNPETISFGIGVSRN